MIREDKTGMLYLCATPIGNLEDVTLRVLRILKEADVVAAEDTRQSIKLLNHYEIKTPLVSYHEHNKYEKTPVLVQRMLKGETIALVTDAGTPAISDPGEDLVRACYEAGIPVTSLPGPAAVITALTIFYEAPHRLKKTLALFCELLGENHRISICKELTKKHETALHFTLGEAVAYYEANEPKGEFVLVLEGKSAEDMNRAKQEKWQEMPLPKHMKIYEDKGLSRKEAMKAVAKDRGVSKREIYAKLLEDE